jgi:hypothetical protein
LGTIPVLRVLKVEPNMTTTLNDYQEELPRSPYPLPPVCAAFLRSMPLTLLDFWWKRGWGGHSGVQLRIPMIRGFYLQPKGGRRDAQNATIQTGTSSYTSSMLTHRISKYAAKVTGKDWNWNRVIVSRRSTQVGFCHPHYQAPSSCSP